MKQPNDWELQILPYLSNELSASERERFETYLAEHPEFAQLVSEFRETLAMLEKERFPSEALQGLEGIERHLYRRIAAEVARGSARRHFRLSEWWRTLTGGIVVATASIAVGIYIGMREVEPTPYAPVAQMTLPLPSRSTSLAASPHENFVQSELERRLNEARWIHRVRGETYAALAQYAQIVETHPDSWTSQVAQFEQAELADAVETIQPLLRDTIKPIFTDVESR